MKVLSLKEPFATLILAGKNVWKQEARKQLIAGNYIFVLV